MKLNHRSGCLAEGQANRELVPGTGSAAPNSTGTHPVSPLSVRFRPHKPSNSPNSSGTGPDSRLPAKTKEARLVRSPISGGNSSGQLGWNTAIDNLSEVRVNTSSGISPESWLV